MLLSLADEDIEWTAERNKDLTGIFYRKITFKPDIQAEVCDYIDTKIKELTAAMDKITEENNRKKEVAEREKQQLLEGVKWKIDEKNIRDEGGKTTEYIHHIIINGTEYIFKERNVFDVGRCVTDNNGLVDLNNLVGDELRAATIVYKYGKYKDAWVRM